MKRKQTKQLKRAKKLKAAKAAKKPATKKPAVKKTEPKSPRDIVDAFGNPDEKKDTPKTKKGKAAEEGHGEPPAELVIANLPSPLEVKDYVRDKIDDIAKAFPDNCRPSVNDKGVTVFVCDSGATEEDVLRAAVAGFDVGKEAHGIGCFSMFLLGETVRAHAKITGSSQRASAKTISDFLQEKTSRRINFGTLDNWARTCDKIPPALRNYAADPTTYIEIAIGIPDKRVGDDDSADSVSKTNQEIAARRRALAKRVYDGDALERKDVIDEVHKARKDFGFGGTGAGNKQTRQLEHELAHLTLAIDVLLIDAAEDDTMSFMVPVKGEKGKFRKKTISKSKLEDRRTATVGSLQNLLYGEAVKAYQLGITDPNNADAEYPDWPFGE